jgi:trimethylamine--corrinoid protein Co-methyltransferase
LIKNPVKDPLFSLSLPDIERIHRSSLRILNEVGFFINNKEAIDLLVDNGSLYRNGRIYLPINLIEKCIQQCPPNVELIGRESKLTLGNGNLYIHNMGGARDVLDSPESNIRSATAKDVEESTRLLDALENVSSITPLYTPRDVSASSMVPTMFYQTIKNTTKPINGPGLTSLKELTILYEMACVVFSSHPKFSLSVSPVSPLNFTGDVSKLIIEIAKLGIPFGPLPCPTVGATAPMSLAGALVQQNSEVLACIVLAQLTNPGLPIVYCGRLSVINMRNAAPMWGNPEIGLLSAGTVQIGHYYGLPVNVYGLTASVYTFDIQSGYERALNAIIPALVGADELSGIGEMAGGIFSSNAQMVIDNDIMGMILRLRKGFIVDDDSLAVEIIVNVMNDKRNFLSERHTKKFLHAGELWEGKLHLTENSWDLWQQAGKPDAPHRAQKLAEEILSKHEVYPITPEQDKELDKIMLSLNE